MKIFSPVRSVVSCVAMLAILPIHAGLQGVSVLYAIFILPIILLFVGFKRVGRTCKACR